MTTVNDRGFLGYADVETTYGHHVRVYESSAASGPHVWLNVDLGQTNASTAHLNVEQATAVRDALNEFLDGIPGRWAVRG